ncbi:MAG: hypothetical protein WDZ79_00685 [Candidatus Paceibacterota bacterium]
MLVILNAGDTDEKGAEELSSVRNTDRAADFKLTMLLSSLSDESPDEDVSRSARAPNAHFFEADVVGLNFGPLELATERVEYQEERGFSHRWLSLCDKLV